MGSPGLFEAGGGFHEEDREENSATLDFISAAWRR